VPKEKTSSGQIWGEREMTLKIKTKGPKQGLAKNPQNAAPAVYLLKPPHCHHPEATKRPTYVWIAVNLDATKLFALRLKSIHIISPTQS